MGTREKILEEALTLFSQKGYNGVSVREMCIRDRTYTGRLLSALWGNAYSSSSLPLLILFSQF